jgi:hypothetical protein
MRIHFLNFIIIHKDFHPNFEFTTSHTKSIVFTTKLNADSHIQTDL